MGVKSAFTLFETQAQGAVSKNEMGTIIRALGLNPSEAQLARIIDMIGPEDSGFVLYDKFLPVVLDILKTRQLDGELLVRDTEEDIIQAFQVLDAELRTYVNGEELKDQLMTMGERFTQDEAMEMLNTAADPETAVVRYADYAATLVY